MKLICLLAITAGFAQAQQLPRVDGPRGVDVNVNGITWHPQGMGLMYTKPEVNGTGLGVYAMGQPEGEVVVHLGPNDRYEAQWFDNQTFATIIVYRDLMRDGQKWAEATVYLADAMKGQAQVLWSQAYTAESGGIDLDVDVSPKLKHAIYRVKNGKNRYHMVLPINGSHLIASADLDRAQKDGLSGPSWSTTGTAIFAPQTGDGAINEFKISDGSVIKTSGGEVTNGSVTFEVRLDSVMLERIKGDLIFLVAKPPPPPIGASVLELMPANATLRQVRFKGPWVDRELAQNDLRTMSRPANLQFGQSGYAANSLWLVRGKEPRDGVLLAAHADQSWISPGMGAVAYLTDGALFVRTLGPMPR